MLLKRSCDSGEGLTALIDQGTELETDQEEPRFNYNEIVWKALQEDKLHELGHQSGIIPQEEYPPSKNLRVYINR